MVSGEAVRWKLARCAGCGKQRTMLAESASCPACETSRRATTLSDDDVRWIVAYREPESFVLAAWRLATPSTNAATGLDTNTGRVTVHRWPAGEEMPVDELYSVLVLAVCLAHRRAELPGLLAAGAEGTLSEEDAEELAAEAVVEAALGDGGERFWAGVDAQLKERRKEDVPENR